MTMTIDEIDLRSWRKRLGLSQGQLAALLGVSMSYISNIETGRYRRLFYPRLWRLALERLEQGIPEQIPISYPANEFRHWIEQQKFSQGQLARMLGVSTAQISKMKTGQRKIAHPGLWRFALERLQQILAAPETLAC